MVLTALRGAIGFLSRLPVGRDGEAWDAFRRTPAAFPLAGYVVGALVALPLLLPLPGPTVSLLFVAAVYGVTGINHVDGLADLGDAAAVHGANKRRAVMKDTRVGVGAVLAVALDVAGLALAGLALAEIPVRVAVAVVVVAEVGAKLGMAGLAAFGEPAHEGLGSQLVGQSPRRFALALLVALPAAALPWLAGADAGSGASVGVVTIGAGLLAVAAVAGWARPWLGGVSGDVFGAGNELARLAALHAGVIAWTLS